MFGEITEEGVRYMSKDSFDEGLTLLVPALGILGLKKTLVNGTDIRTAYKPSLAQAACYIYAFREAGRNNFQGCVH